MASIRYFMKKYFTSAGYGAEYVSFFVFVISAIALIIYIWFQPWAYRRTGDGLGIAIFPTFFLVGVIILSLACLIDTHKKGKTEKPKVEHDDNIVEWGYMILLAIITISISFTMRYIDPLILVVILSTAILLIAGIRQWFLIVGTAVGLMLFIYVFIIRLAQIYFPTSWLF